MTRPMTTPTSKRTLEIFQWNARKGYLPMVALFNASPDDLGVTLGDMDVICIQEAWRNPWGDIPTTYVGRNLAPSYHLVYAGTQTARLATYVHKRLPTSSWRTRVNEDNICPIEITPSGTIHYIANGYQPPGETATLESLVAHLGQAPEILMIILGDFNAHHPDWSSEDIRANAAG